MQTRQRKPKTNSHPSQNSLVTMSRPCGRPNNKVERGSVQEKNWNATKRIRDPRCLRVAKNKRAFQLRGQACAYASLSVQTQNILSTSKKAGDAGTKKQATNDSINSPDTRAGAATPKH